MSKAFSRSTLTTFATYMIAMTVAFVVYSLWQSRQQIEDNARTDAENISRLLERYLYTAFHETDLALIASTEEYRRIVASNEPLKQNFNRFLAAQRERIPLGATLRGSNAQGFVSYYGSDPEPASPVDISDRSHFQWARDGSGESMTISPPILSRVNQTWILPLSRPLRSHLDEFGGTVYAVIPVDALSGILSSLDLDRHGTITLLDADARVLLQQPESKGPGSSIGFQVNAPEFLAQWEAGKRVALFQARDVTDDQWRTYSYRQVGHYPVHVMVGLASQDYLAPWWREAAIDTVFLISLLAALLLLRRSWRARDLQHYRYEHLLRTASDGIHILDAGGNLIEANDAFCAMLGYAREELIGQHISLWDAVHSRSELDNEILPRLAQAREIIETRHRRRDGSLLDVQISATGVELYQERLIYASSRDVTEQKRAEELLRLGHVAFTSSREAIIVTDGQALILDVNPAFTTITGYSRNEVIGRNPRFLQSGRQDAFFYRGMWEILLAQGAWEGELWNRRKNGEFYIQQVKISAVSDSAGQITRYVCVGADVTRSREDQRRIEHMAYYDALTHLPNRTLLTDRLRQALAQADRRETLLAICYMDLDGFKPVNDTWGHGAGDQVLVEVGRRLQSCVRASDTVARLGGDEFVVLVGDVADIHQIDQAVHRILGAIAMPFAIGTDEARLSVSIGITIYPNDGEDPDTLIRHADQAMYSAKQAGKNCAHIFDPDDDRRMRADRELMSGLEAAMANGELRLHYQPKVNMRLGTVVGLEALLRWQHPQQGLLLPDDFLPAIRNTDLAVTLDRWVLRDVLRQIANWSAHDLELPVSVNISGQYIQNERLYPDLARMFSEFPTVRPQWLELEILETTAMDDMEVVSRIMSDCSTIGVRFALDDFGTGYSSLTYFRRLPTAFLKIDQTFIRDMLEDADDLAIVEGVVSLAHTFHRQVIAEGVESIAHGIPLLQFGCDLAQGYVIARPMPAGEVPGWVRSWKNPPEWQQMAAEHWPREDLPLLLAGFHHQRWVQRIIDICEGRKPNEGVPLQKSPRCRFGQWLYGIAQERYSAFPTILAALESAHDRVHRLGDQLAAGPPTCPEVARASIAELAAARDELLRHLDSLKCQLASGGLAGPSSGQPGEQAAEETLQAAPGS